MKTYYAAVDGFIHDRQRKKGDKISLTDGQAKYLVMSGLVTLEAPTKAAAAKPDPKPEPEPATLERKTR